MLKFRDQVPSFLLPEAEPTAPLSKLQTLYRQEIERGHLSPDAAQRAALEQLDALATTLTDFRHARKGALSWIFGSKTASVAPKGLYIWGAVGRGKTMMMDLFFESIDLDHKKRVHFHAFMSDVHARIHAWRQLAKKGAVKGDDPIPHVAEEIAAEASLLCFDEFSVTDITDAMILGRLFTALFQRETVIVATSNVHPSDLYRDGLNRTLFLPFIDLIEQKMEIVELKARTDFRLEKLQDAAVYHVPADDKARDALTRSFKALTGVEHGEPRDLHILGRTLRVPEARGNVARFSFSDLCEAALGPQDYLAIARAFHTVFVDDIRIMDPDERNEAKRLIIFIDALYDQHVKLIASATAEPDGLLKVPDGTEAFEFRRTISRLMEMRSSEYLALPHGSVASIASGHSSGLVET